MGNIAIIKNGIVANVISVTDSERPSVRANWVAAGYTVLDDVVASPGDAWNGSVFTPPGGVTSEDTWLIGVGAFYDRFGDQKIPILASADPVVQAMIRDAQVRKYIDLKRADLPMMLATLVAKGFPIEPNPILNTPAAAHELP